LTARHAKEIGKGRGVIEASRVRAAPAQARASVRARLEARWDEIERAALTRVYSVSDPRDTANPEYAERLRTAVSAAIEYGLAGIDRSGGEPHIPSALLEQARLAARSGVSLDTVLRRYVAGYTLLGDFLIEEARADDSLPSVALQQVMRDQAMLFDRLIAAVTAEHKRESEVRKVSVEERRAARIRGLLAGDFIDTSELAYDFEGWHLGALVVGEKADEAIRHLAKVFGRTLLLVPADEETLWAWLGGRQRIDPLEFEQCIASAWPSQFPLAIGEPGCSIGGWRLTHQQARAAMQVALGTKRSVARYADVALLAATLQDDLFATSLREMYLVPLEGERDGGLTLRRTLRAYFAADRNVSSAAAALGVNRHTVASRLRVAEERFGRSLGSCGAELEAALQLEEFEDALLVRPRASFDKKSSSASTTSHSG
jgi:hypothetical protein